MANDTPLHCYLRATSSLSTPLLIGAWAASCPGAYLPLGVGSLFGHHLLQNPFWIPLMLQAEGFPVLSLPLASGSTFPMTTVTL